MKLNVATDFETTGNVTPVGKFSIKQSPLAFQILSSSLYSDKIMAVIRELACNAADSHIAAGTPDKPIEVKLPNNMDRTFYVKDWGPGLTHDEICHPEHGLYTTYFASTKTNSNDETGAFGLGSKSPFAYTDQFTVESARDGQHRVYVCYKDQGGYLSCDLMETRAASDDWPHGLKVSMPVAPGDWAEFSKKAIDLFQWFKVTPKLIPSSVRVESMSSIGPFGFEQQRSAYGYYGRAHPRVVMGNVQYPIETAKLREGTTSSLLGAMLNCIYQADTVFRVPIGTVSITPSRESVEYTKETIVKLNKFIVDTFAEKFETLLLKVRATDGSLSALTALQKADKDKAYWGQYANIFKDGMKRLADLVGLALTDEDVARLSIVLNADFPMKALFPNFDDKTRIGQILYARARNDGKNMVSGAPLYVNGSLSDVSQYTFYIDDCKSADHILKWNLREENIAGPVVFIGDEGIITHLRSVSRAPNLSRVSSLEKPPKKPRVKGKRSGAPRKKGEGRQLPVYDLTKDYDDDEFEGHNLNSGFTPPTQYLCDIPTDQRFYITRDASYGRRSWQSVGNKVNISHGYWSSSPEYLFEAMAEVRRLLPGIGGPTKIMVLTNNVCDQLKEKGIMMRPLVDGLEEVAQKIVDEATTLRKALEQQTAATKTYDHELYQLVAQDESHPCTYEGDAVLDFTRTLWKSQYLRDQILPALPDTHPIHDVFEKITLAQANPDGSKPTDSPVQQRYNQLTAAYSKLTQFGRGWPQLDPNASNRPQRNNIDRLRKLFDDMAKDKTLLYAACLMRSPYTDVQEKVGEERVAKVLLAALT